MSDFLAIWPITDPTHPDLYGDAITDLHDLLADANLVPVGPVTWTRNGRRIVARLPVQIDVSPTGDGRPWESRQAYADEMLDRSAA